MAVGGQGLLVQLHPVAGAVGRDAGAGVEVRRLAYEALGGEAVDFQVGGVGDGRQQVHVQFVDAVRGLTRPALTWSLFALVGAIYFLLGAADITTVGLRPRIVETVLYLFTAAMLWWFGSRQIEKRRGPEGGAGR